jgi:hypothetical protein
LSDEDKAAFRLVVGLVPKEDFVTQPQVVFEAPSVPIQPTYGRLEFQNSKFRTVVEAQGAEASYMAHQGFKGLTKDPRTGKKYQISQAVTRSKEYLALENVAEKARISLREHRRKHGYTYDPKSNQTYDSKQKVLDPIPQDYQALIESSRMANANLKKYKETHQEEFSPPKRAVARRRSRSRGRDDSKLEPNQSSTGASGSGSQKTSV